jgi:hypothetical protein
VGLSGEIESEPHHRFEKTKPISGKMNVRPLLTKDYEEKPGGGREQNKANY